MRKKKIIIAIAIIFILALIFYFIYTQVEITNSENQITEYTPEAEITEEQLRQTTISLYFNNTENNTLVPEARNIDVKELTKEPYQTILNLLIAGPQSDKLENTIPEGTLINNIELKDNILWIDFSQEFITNHKGGAEEEAKTIYAIVNTMTQLNEVDGIKIVIEGKEDCAFLDNAISLKDAFVPKDETT